MSASRKQIPLEFGAGRANEWVLLFLLLGFFLGPVTHGQDVSQRVPASGAPASAALQSGDAVKLRIWREPDLSGRYPVDHQGEITFPKIGVLRVSGLSTDSLKRFLVAAYAPFLRDPSIEVTLLRRVTVAGSVRNPGLYEADETMTISDVLALAGGPAPDGAPEKVTLVRNGDRVTSELSGATPIGDSPLRSGDQLYVPQRSWLSRNTGIVAALISSVGIIVATVFR
jgi:polysaccharide export outer membrane protein